MKRTGAKGAELVKALCDWAEEWLTYEEESEEADAPVEEAPRRHKSPPPAQG